MKNLDLCQGGSCRLLTMGMLCVSWSAVMLSPSSPWFSPGNCRMWKTRFLGCETSFLWTFNEIFGARNSIATLQGARKVELFWKFTLRCEIYKNRNDKMLLIAWVIILWALQFAFHYITHKMYKPQYWKIHKRNIRLILMITMTEINSSNNIIPRDNFWQI